MLVTIRPYNQDSEYCKILNVNDGSLTDVVSCNQNTREWSAGDIDPSATSIRSATDNEDGTVDIVLRRNNANIGITGIPYLASGQSTDLYYDQFTVKSIYTTFLFLAPYQYNFEVVRITFNSETDNSSPKVVNMGLADDWNKWEVGNTPNLIPVYENAHAVQLPLVCCLCDGDFIARYYFTYDATSGDISGIKIDTEVWGGKVDTLAQKAYDWDVFLPTSIIVQDLANIGGESNTYQLDLNYTTPSPTAETLTPTKSPTISPTKSPTKVPTKAPTRSTTISPTKAPIDIGISTTDVTSNRFINGTAMLEEKSNDIFEITLDNMFYVLLGGIILLCCILFGIAWLDSKCCCRRNDHFQISALIAALIQILDMFSDIFFAINALSHYNDTDSFQGLLIFILSVVFILFPIIISLYQLHSASSKYWLYNNRIREWLLSYSKLLYIVSVITGSSFAAIQIFNSNLFGLDIFCMGIPKQYLLSFTTKKVYSIILFENCPQLFLSCWYTILMGEITWIPTIQMIFSLISIVTTIISMVLQKKIYKTQDYVYITIDITGKCIMDNMKICRKRINGIKSYLCRSVLGINEKSVEIMKPFSGSVINGLQLQIHISYIHHKSNINVAEDYEGKLANSMENGSLQQVIREEWKLSNTPHIEDIKCEFIRSKEKKQLSIAARARTTEKINDGENINIIEMNKEIDINT